MMPLKRLVLLGLFVVAPMLAPEASQAGDPIIGYEKNDPKMNAAITEAQGTLGIFLANTLGPKNISLEGSSLKVSFDAADYGDEIIWVSDFSHTSKGHYVGYLANEPHHLPGKHNGSKVRFDTQQIRDWAYYGENGQLFGHYTTRVMVTTMPQKQAKPIRDMLSDHPVPESWKPF